MTQRDFGVDVPPPVLSEEEQADQAEYRSTTRSSRDTDGTAREAHEQASAIAFLASHDASYITGQVLAVGGGQPYPF